MPKITKHELIKFEKEIEELYLAAKIRAPIHLSKGDEEQLIEIFKNIKSTDWVFSYYRSHYHALLKGIPKDWLKKEILEGKSMHIMSKEHKFFTSSIVAGQLPIALGTALAIKKKKLENHVWTFCGDMAAETGVFHECVKYAVGHDLPITFIVCNDRLSVYTPTKDVWKASSFDDNSQKPLSSFEFQNLKEELTANAQVENKKPRIIKYNYERGWPHHGIGLWIEYPDDKTSKLKLDSYHTEIKKAMNLLAEDPRTIFLGQTVCYKGSPIWESVKEIPEERRIELPIMEEVQMGMSIGLALEGYIPVSIYPRIDFLILTTNQLVNHLDKIKELSHGRFNPKVIIRTMIGDKEPLYPGPQHCQDHTSAYKLMLTNTDVVRLDMLSDIVKVYKNALESGKSTLIIETDSLRGK